jgi:hypothetical protein
MKTHGGVEVLDGGEWSPSPLEKESLAHNEYAIGGRREGKKTSCRKSNLDSSADQFSARRYTDRTILVQTYGCLASQQRLCFYGPVLTKSRHWRQVHPFRASSPFPLKLTALLGKTVVT